MTTDEVLRIINNSYIMSIQEFINKSKKLFPEINEITVVQKQDMGLSGILAWAEFNYGRDRIIIKGFLYPTKNWNEDTHGYVIAKKI